MDDGPPYAYLKDRGTGQSSFSKKVGTRRYPYITGTSPYRFITRPTTQQARCSVQAASATYLPSPEVYQSSQAHAALFAAGEDRPAYDFVPPRAGAPRDALPPTSRKRTCLDP